MVFHTVLILLAASLLHAQEPPQPERSVTGPGVITTRQAITPAGLQSLFQGRVYGVAFGADASEVWVLGARHLSRLDWRRNRVVERIPLDGASGLQGVHRDPASGRILAAFATSARARLLAIGQGKEPAVWDLGAKHLTGAPAVAGQVNRAGQRIAAVPLTHANQLAVVDLNNPGKVLRRIRTGIAPFAAVLSSDGSSAWVSNWGGRIPRPDDATLPAGLGEDADRVVVDERGIASGGTVQLVNIDSGERIASAGTGLHPTALAWDQTRGRLYVANGNGASVSVVDTRTNRPVRTMPIRPFGHTIHGVAPAALALDPQGTTLYVACGGLNAVAVMDAIGGTVRGFIPTAWYPNDLSLSADGRKHLAVATLLGAGSGWRDEPRKRFVHSYRGSVAVVPAPDPAQLAGYSTAVAENNHLSTRAAPRPAPRPAAKPRAVPGRAGEPSLIEHVVYIIKENRTYDQVFGDIPEGNGDLSLVMFGEDVTPNQHRLARQFVLYDNFYATGGNSGDGHQWLTQADETDYCLWPGYLGRSYPFDGTDPIAYAATGFIWDAALRMKKTVRVYGEYAGRLSEPVELRARLFERWKSGGDFTREWNIEAPLKPLNRILAKNYPPYTNSIPDVVRARIFLADVARWQREGAMPNFVILQLPCDHTFGTRPNASTPRAMVADNDLALGQIVEALTRTPFWKKMAIFVVEDDAQNGVDHVDGHRTTALAISPYVRRGFVDSTFYSQPGMLKTIELILGLPSLTLFDLIATEMRASFTDTPDFSGYAAVQPKQSLDEVNPPLSALSGEALRAAMDSQNMFFDTPDAAPADRLNRILWGQIKGWNAPYPEARRPVFSPLSADLDDGER